MSDPLNPDHTKGTGEGAQAAPGASFPIKDHHLPIFAQGSCKADRGTASRFALVAEDRNSCQVLHVMHIEASITLMLYLAGCLAGATANALTDIDVNRHLIPPGFPAGWTSNLGDLASRSVISAASYCSSFSGHIRTP
jgi:hypothetical protein